MQTSTHPEDKKRTPQTISFDELPNSAFAKSKTVQVVTARTRQWLWSRVKDGTFPPPFDFGGTARAWNVGEIRQYLSACGTGKNQDQIRQFVKELVAARSN